MTRDLSNAEGVPPIAKIALVAVLLASGVLAVALPTGAAVLIDHQIETVEPRIELETVRPSPECATLVLDVGKKAIGSLIDIAGALSIPIPGGDDTPAPQGSDDDALPKDGDGGNSDAVDQDNARVTDGDKLDDSEDKAGGTCHVDLVVTVAIDNPLPLAVNVDVIGIEAEVAGREIPDEQMRLHARRLTIGGDETGTFGVSLRFEPGDMFAAASGLLLARRVEVTARPRIRVSALWGLVEREIDVQIDEELKVSDLLKGFGGEDDG